MKRDPLLVQAIQLLSMRVAKLRERGFGELFSLTSCVNPEESEIIGYAKAFITLFPEDPFSKDLNEAFIPAIEKIGVARWTRTELTHLGGRLANKETRTISLSKSDLPPEVSNELPSNTAKETAQ